MHSKSISFIHSVKVNTKELVHIYYDNNSNKLIRYHI